METDRHAVLRAESLAVLGDVAVDDLEPVTMRVTRPRGQHTTVCWRIPTATAAILVVQTTARSVLCTRERRITTVSA